MTVFCTFYLSHLAQAAYGNTYDLKGNETVLYEEEGYVEIQIGDEEVMEEQQKMQEQYSVRIDQTAS